MKSLALFFSIMLEIIIDQFCFKRMIIVKYFFKLVRHFIICFNEIPYYCWSPCEVLTCWSCIYNVQIPGQSSCSGTLKQSMVSLWDVICYSPIKSNVLLRSGGHFFKKSFKLPQLWWAAKWMFTVVGRPIFICLYNYTTTIF